MDRLTVAENDHLTKENFVLTLQTQHIFADPSTQFSHKPIFYLLSLKKNMWL